MQVRQVRMAITKSLNFLEYADVNLQRYDCVTALMFASQNAYYQIIELLKEIADPNLQRQSG